jgi:aminoglycoside phosphotransferase (APT) family kinase protein
MFEPNAIPAGKPEAEIVIDPGLVRDLIAAQHTDLTTEALDFFAEGWDNVMFRLGSKLLVRLPRRKAAAQLIHHEQAWLPTIAPRLPLPVPVPLRVGIPSEDYPWHWSIVRLLPGVPLDQSVPTSDCGAVIGAFLRALHDQPLPPDAPRNAVRGVALASRREAFEKLAIPLVARDLLPVSLKREWVEAQAVAIDTCDCWLHGDLHALNVLVEDGSISAVIDWGDMCAGDRATDLASLWTVLPNARGRKEALEAYGAVSTSALARARGWAIYFAAAHLSAGLVNSPRHACVGTEIIRNLLD